MLASMKKPTLFLKIILPLFLLFTTPLYASLEKVGFEKIYSNYQNHLLSKKKPRKAAVLKYSEDFILKKALEYKKKEFNPNIALPQIFVESKTTLKQFQDAIEPQWGQRPEMITNAFVIHLNQIYLLDDINYYQKLKRCMDDSLMHEYIHYIQAKYQNFDLNDDTLEMEAVEHQTRFREEYCQ